MSTIKKHPHVRGEDFLSVIRQSQSYETPPRAWGRHVIFKDCDGDKGNTPTCVGKTINFPPLSKPWKHPHVRGEDLCTGGWLCLELETPPRAWGRHQREIVEELRRGNTPTCVGKTLQSLRSTDTSQKHPHVRGEDSAKHRTRLPSRETPPRAWGRRKDGLEAIQKIGNTPTCVGKTLILMQQRPQLRKHPHVRGEDSKRRQVLMTKTETPPRAWGRHTIRNTHLARLRNTPTCVGKTRTAKNRKGQAWKHPHVRGEDIFIGNDPTWAAETPPRAWGRPPEDSQHVVDSGNTPTCVGKTKVRNLRCNTRWKHPHVRGEDADLAEEAFKNSETPPRAWGRPRLCVVT